ncbi:unnamed protein product [Debaryomyces fabryi]|nr:unnamed protein product [Debaryomyces fabryi]
MIDKRYHQDSTNHNILHSS